ncbi:MAG: pilus assembly protein [Methyloprofundus sp.]|nr:pilus assembly protein [Methyloprofundus sp.]
MKILHRDELPLGGFAGLQEHRLVVDHRMGGSDDTWDGLGSFVYLADAQFLPHGETRMHSHKEIDVISVMVHGRINHEGSLQHGQAMLANQVQVQRAGGEGFKHNEINPDALQNRMIQLWVLPETAGETANYKFYDLEPGKAIRVYGGAKDQEQTLDSHTIMDVALLNNKQHISKSGEFMAYLCLGSGELNEQVVQEGDLVRGVDMDFTATAAVQLIIITTEEF